MYDAKAIKDYELRVESHRKALYPAQIEALELDQRLDVLDIGCGNGALTERIAQHAGNVVAIDNNPDFITEARRNLRQHTNVDVRQLDATEILSDFPAGRFDRIVASMVFIHARTELELRLMIDQASAALKTGGYLVFTDLSEYFVRNPPKGERKVVGDIARGKPYQMQVKLTADRWMTFDNVFWPESAYRSAIRASHGLEVMSISGIPFDKKRDEYKMFKCFKG